MRRPTDAQIATAALWLREAVAHLNSDDETNRDCHAVADWIEHLQREHNLKVTARKAGVSMRKVREYIRKVEGKQP